MILDYLKEELKEYEFRLGSKETLPDIFALEQENTEFFAMTQKHEVTIEEAEADFTACPSGFPSERKVYRALYQNGCCIAILDYLEGYPKMDTAYIGYLMIKRSEHGKGIGKKINTAFFKAAKACGYQKVKLGCYRSNEPGYWFWRKNGYLAEKMEEREIDGERYQLLHMVCDISAPHMLEDDLQKSVCYRKECEADYFASELMTKRAFWNKHHLGCDEHYLVHCLREDKVFVPELSMVAELEGNIVGGIWYSKALVKKGEQQHEVLTFGPLCVDPQYQGTGIGGELLRRTMALAKESGYLGIIIFGEPGYYPKHGFLTCDQFHIATSDGKNFDAFMGIELRPGGMKELSGGKFFEGEVFENLPEQAVEEYNRKFPYMEKLKVPGQWD